MINQEIINQVKQAIKKTYPSLHFKIRKVNFLDLARNSQYFLESSYWGMSKGNQETFQKVKEIVENITKDIIVEW